MSNLLEIIYSMEQVTCKCVRVSSKQSLILVDKKERKNETKREIMKEDRRIERKRKIRKKRKEISEKNILLLNFTIFG